MGNPTRDSLVDDRLVDSGGHCLRRGFYSDNKGRLILLRGLNSGGRSRGGFYYPGGNEVYFHFFNTTFYSPKNLTPVDAITFFNNNEWEFKGKWSLEKIEDILKDDYKIAREEAHEINNNKGNFL